MANSFSAAAARQAARVKSIVAGKVVTYGLTLHQQLVTNTPYRSGQARANWQASIGSRGDGFLAYGGYTGQGKGSLSPARGSVPYEAVAAGQERIIKSWQPGAILYIYSNLPYIGDLNAGSSSQAPAGFVEASVLAAEAAIGR